MFLHAHQLIFTHPDTGKEVTLKAALPSDCERFLASLEESASELHTSV
jgi:23S rRNA pseudouridine955/2504/2580 synthase